MPHAKTVQNLENHDFREMRGRIAPQLPCRLRWSTADISEVTEAFGMALSSLWLRNHYFSPPPGARPVTIPYLALTEVYCGLADAVPKLYKI